MRCKTCHYSLANLTENRCPECGNTFDPNDPSTFDLALSLRNRALREALIWLLCTFVGAFFLVVGVLARERGPWYELHRVAMVALFATAFVSPLILLRLLAKLRKAR